MTSFVLVAPLAHAQAVYQFDLPEQPLADSLRAIAAKTGTNILFDSKDVKGVRAAALRATLSLNDALKRVLAGTRLEAENTTPTTIILQMLPDTRAMTGSSSELEEVVVTAQKRVEPVRNVPIPVTVLGGAPLARRGQFRVQDYASQVPGLALTPNQFNGSSTVTIRGISSGDITNPTVSATVDDVALGSSTSIGGGYVVPDLDPSDFSRIEVLRGPQGTLYGASSIGGLLKYVTVEPSTDAVEGRVQAGLSGVYSGSSAGHDLSAGLNMPLSDSLAVRGSAFSRQSPGYIDNAQAGENDVNKTRVYGGQVAALWRPSEQLSFKLTALYQDNKLFGHSYVTLAAGSRDLEQSFLPRTGIVNRRFEALIATATARTGTVDLTSVTGYTVNRYVDRLDYSAPNGQFTVPVFDTPYAINTDDNTTYKFTQEVRLSAPIGSHFEWLLGGYYTREYSSYELELLAADTAGNSIGRGQVSTFPSIYAEWAEFTDLTYRFSDQFDIQIGGRSSQIRQTYTETDWGPLIDPSGTPFVIPESSARARAFTYLVAPRWRVSPDSMVYARLASGYRPGGINPGSVEGIPSDFKPDRTKNYELGIKADFFDRRLSIDTSLYYIDWLGVQVSLTDPVTTKIYFTNGGRAKSEGIEVSAELSPAAGWRLAGWISYDNAVLTQAMPPNSTVYGNSGDRLPYTSRFSALASADYEVRVGRFAVSYGGTVSYVGDRVGTFVGTSTAVAPDRQPLPGYVRIDLRSGLTVERWSLELYANNITDRRGLIGGGIGTQIPTAFELIQPRTIGLALSRTF